MPQQRVRETACKKVIAWMPRVIPGVKQNPRGKLRTLPVEVQDRIFEYSVAHSLPEIQAWLKAEMGIDMSIGGLSQYLRWQRLERQARTLWESQDQLKAILKKHKDLSPAELDRYAESLFRVIAVERMDVEAYSRITFARRKLDLEEMRFHQAERKIALEARKLEFMVKQAERAQQLANKPISEEEKKNRILELFNIPAPALPPTKPSGNGNGNGNGRH